MSERKGEKNDIFASLDNNTGINVVGTKSLSNDVTVDVPSILKLANYMFTIEFSIGPNVHKQNIKTAI